MLDWKKIAIDILDSRGADYQVYDDKIVVNGEDLIIINTENLEEKHRASLEDYINYWVGKIELKNNPDWNWFFERARATHNGAREG
jgi:hypothetical protein